jgi:haloacetate dehalogenase
MAPISGFESHAVATDQGDIFLYQGGSGPPVLLLHGFPETSLMWHAVAPVLAKDFTVIAADLPGYGRSYCPADAPDHASMSKREMAAALIAPMRRLGYDRFAIVGHDRGGRVAYRAALDHPSIVAALVVLDVIPTLDVWDRADARLALAFWPFSLLAQPAPLPERILAAIPDAVIDNALGQWGSPPAAFPAWLRQDYIEALSDPAHAHAICEEYRAAATIDRANDKADLDAGRRIACPVLALWSGKGALATWYEEEGGPLALWRRWADQVDGRAMEGGHFFPEELPGLTADLIGDFLAKCQCRSSSMPQDPRFHAQAEVTVNSHEAVPYDDGSEPALVEIRIEETFAGDLEGSSTVRALQVAHREGSASLLTLQRFRGRLDGKSGTFVLEGRGSVEQGQIEVKWSVVPQSGTEELAGLCGEGGFKGRFGEGSTATLDFWFE